MKKRIQALTSKDYEGCMALWKTCKQISVREFENEDLFQNVVMLNPETCICVKEDQKIIATALGTTDGWRGYIHRLAVDTDHRKQGIAGALVNHVNTYFYRQGLSKAHVFVMRTNKIAQQFFFDAGWDERKDLEIHSCLIAGKN